MANHIAPLVDASPGRHPLGRPLLPATSAPTLSTRGARTRGPWDSATPTTARSVLGDLAAFLRLLRAWAKGSYTSFPARSVLLIAAAALYVVSPIDLIPDFIPLVGVIDDATVVALVLRALRKDVRPFVDWESARA